MLLLLVITICFTDFVASRVLKPTLHTLQCFSEVPQRPQSLPSDLLGKVSPMVWLMNISLVVRTGLTQHDVTHGFRLCLLLWQYIAMYLVLQESPRDLIVLVNCLASVTLFPHDGVAYCYHQQYCAVRPLAPSRHVFTTTYW